MGNASDLLSLSCTKAYGAMLAKLKKMNVELPGKFSKFILRKFVYDPNPRKITKGEVVAAGLLARNGDYHAFINRLIEIGLVHRTFRTFGEHVIPEFQPGHLSLRYVNQLLIESKHLATLKDLEAKADRSELAEKADRSEVDRLRAEHEALKARMSIMEPRMAGVEQTLQALVNAYLMENPPHTTDRVEELVSNMREGRYCIPSDRKVVPGKLVLVKSQED